ncbi:protein SWEETIE isoform X2 [Nymphaea colorata]|uniref:protein SWEETIE isoform X2 n=1 Tax=Nymphaea colorata TaxID=210225 RepID=UPI00129ED8B4|nr:protein SWEETIE isoform X2 [Nymphaea colorata]
MARQQASVREGVPLSRFGILVAQLESIVASAHQQAPDPLLCFDLLSDLVSAIDEEPKESIILWQRKCEDALHSLLKLGARRPVWRLASLAMVKVISKGEGISVYSRASSLQGRLSDGRRADVISYAGAAHCLGELYNSFGRRIASGLIETTNITAKLMKFHEEFVRQEALQMLQNALEGSGGGGSSTAYSEAYRTIMRLGMTDKSPTVRIVAARCLTAFASIGGPGLGPTEFEHCATCCVKSLEDPASSVRDAFSKALGALLALGMHSETQVQTKTKLQSAAARKVEGGIQKHLIWPFVKASGHHSKELRVGITLSWVYFLQTMCLKYLLVDVELQQFALQAMYMLNGNSVVDAHPLACVLYILRVGITEQMTEPTQRKFLFFLGTQLELPGTSPAIKVATLRTLSFLLTTLGEVPMESKDIFDRTVVAALSHPSFLVRVEAALALRAIAEIDSTCAGNLISCGVTTLHALRESASFEKGDRLKVELDSLHGQAAVLAALLSISPVLLLGCPARLQKAAFEVAKDMITECSSNPIAAAVEKEAGWLLLASSIASMPKEVLNAQVFDILALWAMAFQGNTDLQIKPLDDLKSEVCVWTAAVEALTAFTKKFISSNMTAVNKGILLQPVLVYLSAALSCISCIPARQSQNIKPVVDLFVIRTLIAYQSLPDPMLYKNDHMRMIEICTTPFREPSGCEESSSLRLLLDKRDSCLGPWVLGRDWFEDELRAFEGGTDGANPYLWDNELPSFPQPETLSKMLVNQMLSCLGIMFATQGTKGKLMLLSLIQQSLKSGKKQSWHTYSTTNACVALLTSLKSSLALRPQPLEPEILSLAQSIFQGILSDGDVGAAQRRAACEGLGLLSRLGNDSFTARMTRSLLNDLSGASDLSYAYAGSLALALGCIHRSAGGMALSTLVPATVNSVSSLAKSSNAFLQAWSLHGLLLTVEAAGLSFISHVQETLMLAMEILLSDENGHIDLRQGIGRLINAIVAVLGPELSPGSTFFSRCKSVILETSAGEETSTLLESVRFTQQLVLFAPQAMSVHSHIQSLLPTLSSRQPALRHLAVSTLRHLIEKEPVAVINEHIEGNLFCMLNEETDSEIGTLVRATIMRLLHASCPSYPQLWIQLCRSVVLATSGKWVNAHSSLEHDISAGNSDGDMAINYGDDREDMIATTYNAQGRGSFFDIQRIQVKNDKHLRYRTRVFAAECLSHIPAAVGFDAAHFDLTLARERHFNDSSDWLVLHIQELVALAFQVSTSQFENMQPMGVSILCTVLDKFEKTLDPEVQGHLLMEQYQAQLVSAVRTALDINSSPLLLEAGLQLAAKILTSGILRGDHVALQRIFHLISRPLDDFEDIYYPSFAEWVACKIKVRLLAAHASVKSYTFRYLRRDPECLPSEYAALIPAFSKSSTVLGRYWISVLNDYIHICFGLQSMTSFKPFLVGVQSSLVSSVVKPCLDEAWPAVLQAVTLDSVPLHTEVDGSEAGEVSTLENYLSGYSMVKLTSDQFNLIWGFALFVLFFHGQSNDPKHNPKIFSPFKNCDNGNKGDTKTGVQDLKPYEVALIAILSLSSKEFYYSGMVSLDLSKELGQTLLYLVHMDASWNDLSINLLAQIVQNCPIDYLENEEFAAFTTELCIKQLHMAFERVLKRSHVDPVCIKTFCTSLNVAETLAIRMSAEKQLSLLLALLCASYTCLRGATSYIVLSPLIAFLHKVLPLLKQQLKGKADDDTDRAENMKTVIGAWASSTTQLCVHYTKSIHTATNRGDLLKLYLRALSFCLEEYVLLAKMVYEIQCSDSNGDDIFYFSIYWHCINCVMSCLSDFHMEVQAIGLHILKTIMEKELGECSKVDKCSFALFFVGEFLEAVLLLTQKLLKNPMTRKSMVIVCDCLKLLLFLHNLPQASESKKDIVNLILEATIMVSSNPTNDHALEFQEVKNLALKLVSSLAHSHASIVHFKEVVMALPATQRQMLQDIVRASVHALPVAPLSAVKLPVQSKTILDPQASSTTSAVVPEIVDNYMEEEDDWNTFQSFPTSASHSESEIHIQPRPIGDSSVSYDNNDAETISHKITDNQPAVAPTTMNNAYEDSEGLADGKSIVNKQGTDEQLTLFGHDDFHEVSDRQSFGVANVSESGLLSCREYGEGSDGERVDNDGRNIAVLIKD